MTSHEKKKLLDRMEVLCNASIETLRRYAATGVEGRYCRTDAMAELGASYYNRGALIRLIIDREFPAKDWKDMIDYLED